MYCILQYIALILYRKRNGFALQFIMPRPFVLWAGWMGGQIQYESNGTLKTFATAPNTMINITNDCLLANKQSLL